MHELCKRLTARFHVIALVPHAEGAQSGDIDGVEVIRYRYAPAKLETLVYGGGIAANLRRSKWKHLLLPTFVGMQWLAVKRLLRTRRIDAIHAHWLIPQGWVASKATRSVPYLVTSHGGDLFGLRGKFLESMKRDVAEWSAAMTVVSSAMATEARRIGLAPPRLDILPMGVDLRERFVPDATVPRASDVLLAVGRLVPKKGFNFLLDAMPAIVRARPNVRLDIAGFGPEEAALRAQAERLGVANHVRFLGAMPQDKLPALVSLLVAAGRAVRARRRRRPGRLARRVDGSHRLRLPRRRRRCRGRGRSARRDEVRGLRRSAQHRTTRERRHRRARRSDRARASRRSDSCARRLARGLGTHRDRLRPPHRALHRRAARVNTAVRQPHIAPDLASRRPKAEKILRLLDLQPRDTPWRVLEVGTGSGGIAHFLGTHPTIRCEVTSVDVVDLRMVRDGYTWQRVEGTALPFGDAAFDVVITNHVIEHVGEHAEQLHHLRECRRVLAPEGRGYLAVPNRWGLVEPHFHLPFLSWLPRAWRSPYVRRMKKGEAYDCELLTLPGIEGLFAEADCRRATWASKPCARCSRSKARAGCCANAWPPFPMACGARCRRGSRR